MTLKKISLLIALGAAAIAPPALAQGAQLYGRLYPFMVFERGSGATAAGAPVSTLAGTPTGVGGITNDTGMSSGNSRWGIRGNEDLGGGLKAIYQLEASISVDNGTGAGFTRDSFLGLDSKNFGTIKAGLLDTVFKDYGDTLGILGISSGTFLSSSDILRKTGFGTSSSSSFHLRRANSLQYTSPEISDLQFGFQWSPDEAKAGIRNPRVLSMGVRYDEGPLYVALAHEIHDDLFGGSRNAPAALRNNAVLTVNSKDKATQLTVEYRLDKMHKFEFDVIRKSYRENPAAAGKFVSYSNTAYLIGMENRWTEQWRTAANYVRSNAGSCSVTGGACTTQGLEGNKITLAAAYYLGRRTYLFGAFSRMSNGDSARFNNAELGPAQNAPGERINHVAFGLSHSF